MQGTIAKGNYLYVTNSYNIGNIEGKNIGNILGKIITNINAYDKILNN